MFAAIGRGVTRRPWFVIAGWLIAAALIILSAPRISSITNPDQSSFLPATAESARAAALAARAFPDSTGVSGIIVITRPGGPLSDADLARVGGLAQRLNADKPAVVRGVLYDPTQTVAANRRVAMLVASFSGPAERGDVRDAVTTLREATTQALAGTGLNSGMTGQAAIVVDNKSAFGHAEKIVTIATLLLIVILLLAIFRSPVAALLPLLTVGLVYLVSTSLVAAGGHLWHFQVGEELPVMMTVVLFGIGTDYILFLLFRYRERLRAGDDPGTAVVTAVARVGEAVASAALAVIAAFGALGLAKLKFFTTLGPALAVGVAVMLFAALTLVPAVVSVLGKRVFWPVRPGAAPARGTRFAWAGRQISRHPVAAVVVGLALLAGLTTGLSSFHSSYDPIRQLPGNTEATRAFHDLQAGFPAGALNPTDVYLHSATPLTQQQIAAFTARLAAVTGVATPYRPQVSGDGRTADIPLILSVEPYSNAALDLVSGPLRDQAERYAPAGTTVLLGGPSMAYADVRDTTNRDLRLIFPIAGLLFVLILAFLLRAALAPVYLVAMVVLGFTATLGTTAWLYADSLAFSIPIVLYLFVTAIGTDYNILMTARLREESREGRRSRAAAALAVEHAGPSVAAAALILAGTFASLLLSGVPFFVQAGFAVTLGIALVAFVVSLLLVPAVTALAGHAAWWPGHRDRTPESDGLSVQEDALTTG